MTKYIHIHAKCNSFEIFEQVPESLSVRRLTQIRENFIWFQERGMNAEQKKSRRKYKGLFLREQKDHLTVKTIVVNPELNFR